MLLSRDAIADVTEIIKNPADFFRPAHQTVFAAIVTRYLDDEPVDPIVLAADLAKSGDLTRIGGAPYLHHLVQQAPSATSGEHYAGIVREKAVLRNLQMACTRTLHQINDGTTETGELLDDLRADVDGIVDDTSSGDEDTLIGADGEDFLEQLEHLQKHGPARGVKTGFTDFDSLTNGLQPGQLIVIAARPAIGKSTLGTDIVRHATIVEGLSAVFFSLEMSRTELKMKIASAQARVALHHLQSQNGMTDDDWTRLAKAWPVINAAPLDIVDDAGLTLTKIRSHCRRIKRKRDLRLVVIDYLQLMEGE
jgi:replicative DNA helicase